MKLSDLITGGDGAAAPPDAPKTMKLSQLFAAPEQPAGGFFERLWNGMAGKDVSRAGRVGMGIADPFYGGAQIGARMEQTPGGGVPEQASAMTFGGNTPDRTGIVDATVQQREAGYQQREKAAGLSGGLGSEWARLVGNVVGTAPLAAVPAGGATIPGRLGMAALGGAAGGAAMPVAGGQFGVEKAKQAGLGAAGGLVGGAIGEGVSAGLGKAIGASLPAAQAQQQTLERFQKAAPMSAAGIRDAPAIAEQQANRLSAVNSIIAEKDDLAFRGPRGTVMGKLPETRQQLAEAYSQVKNKLFQKWDALTQATEASTMPGASPINKFNEAWRESQGRIAQANQDLREANTAYTLAKAQQSSGGNNVYRANAANAAERSARADVQKATANVARAERQAESARADLRQPWVDLKPVASELERAARDEGLRLSPGSEGIISYAQKQAAKYAEEEAASPSGAQRAITNANRSLESFYKNPSYETAARAGVDAMVANKLRSGLDDLITQVTGPGYQQLKLQYGALAASERDVVRAAIKAMGNTPEARFVEGLTSAGTAEELVRGLTSMSLEPATRAVLFRAGQWLSRLYSNPDRQVRLMFQGAERSAQPWNRTAGATLDAARPYATGAGATAGGEAAAALRPPVRPARASVSGE